MIMNNNKAYDYCKKSIKLKTTPKYVKLQMKEFINNTYGDITIWLKDKIEAAVNRNKK